MSPYVTTGIVLKRTNYAEADRIIKFLTIDHGKVSVIAKGVRKSKSKLAGGIELFSESNLSILPGRGGVATLTSSRLKKHYRGIVGDLKRTNTAYEVIQALDKTTEDDCESVYYKLLVGTFKLLDDRSVMSEVASGWFYARLVAYTGHMPELLRDIADEPLEAGKTYTFSFSDGRFVEAATGSRTEEIKLLRLMFTLEPQALVKIKDIDKLMPPVSDLLKKIAQYYLHI